MVSKVFRPLKITLNVMHNNLFTIIVNVVDDNTFNFKCNFFQEKNIIFLILYVD